MHILLIEDDLDLGASLVRALQQDGFTVQWLRRAHDAPLQLDDPGCSAVLLDLGLPDGSGMELLRRWRRAQAAAPVLVITARSALQDRLGGLDAGADDYLVKPFDIPELLARLRAVLRRTAAQSGEQWQFGALSVWPRKCQAQLGGQPLELTPREFQLLLALAQGGGDVVPKRTLAQRLEPLGDPMDTAALQVHISNLRRKIGTERVGTLRGVGYWLESV
ncbi:MULTISPECIES: response regulator transcription factor [unclassified Acidovorax]|jgi:two-component system response regulator BasR|uniref:response regulator n=1 Tax=unclassified Acidovorax TaxID=2684926 RepID=UPI0010E55E37|nr:MULTISPECIES: response regulator transcription factor [unclassified Acidovorax]MCZ8221616.1 response regulator transcription factor [Acidovorax sp.]GDY38259.1 DNA-binding response regulator [Acidovorax sp. NB1]